MNRRIVRCLVAGAASFLVALAPRPALARNDVVILLSDSVTAYDAPVARFRAAIGRPTTVYDLEGNKARAEGIARQLAADPPPLVFALGAKAAYTAATMLTDVPLVHAMVRDPGRYGIAGTQVAGVSMDVAPDAALAQFKLFAPDAQRMGVLLSASNDAPSTAAAIDTARQQGYELKIQRVTNAKDLRAAWERIGDEVDVLWLLPDPVVVTPSSFRYLREETRKRRIPMLASTEALVRAGALLCVAPDRDMLGQQASDLAHRILDEGVLPGSIETPAPGGIRVVLNRGALGAAGLDVDPVLLDFVDEVLEDDKGR